MDYKKASVKDSWRSLAAIRLAWTSIILKYVHIQLFCSYYAHSVLNETSCRNWIMFTSWVLPHVTELQTRGKLSITESLRRAHRQPMWEIAWGRHGVIRDADQQALCAQLRKLWA